MVLARNWSSQALGMPPTGRLSLRRKRSEAAGKDKKQIYGSEREEVEEGP